MPRALSIAKNLVKPPDRSKNSSGLVRSIP
ncbi:Uncharacterised protein [Vibrio cholerae]|nr:Uncharacterised protein [Vibrio cholerae]